MNLSDICKSDSTLVFTRLRVQVYLYAWSLSTVITTFHLMRQTGSWEEYDTMYIAIHLSETITNQVHITCCRAYRRNSRRASVLLSSRIRFSIRTALLQTLFTFNSECDLNATVYFASCIRFQDCRLMLS